MSCNARSCSGKRASSCWPSRTTHSPPTSWTSKRNAATPAIQLSGSLGPLMRRKRGSGCPCGKHARCASAALAGRPRNYVSGITYFEPRERDHACEGALTECSGAFWRSRCSRYDMANDANRDRVPGDGHRHGAAGQPVQFDRRESCVSAHGRVLARCGAPSCLAGCAEVCWSRFRLRRENSCATARLLVSFGGTATGLSGGTMSHLYRLQAA